jgi:hypothetical protein
MTRQERLTYTVYMYSIRLRINQRLVTLGQEDTGTVGVLLRSGNLRYHYWGGFTLTLQQRIKLVVESVTNEQLRNPRSTSPSMKQWLKLESEECLLGSFDGVLVRAYLPFTILKARSGRGNRLNLSRSEDW